MNPRLAELYARIERYANAPVTSPFTNLIDGRLELGRLTFTWAGPDVRGGSDSIPPDDWKLQGGIYARAFIMNDGDEDDGETYVQFDQDADETQRKSIIIKRESNDDLFAYDERFILGSQMELSRDAYFDAMLDHAGIHGWGFLFTDPADLQLAGENHGPRVLEDLRRMRGVLEQWFAYDASKYTSHWERWTPPLRTWWG